MGKSAFLNHVKYVLYVENLPTHSYFCKIFTYYTYPSLVRMEFRFCAFKNIFLFKIIIYTEFCKYNHHLIEKIC